MKVTVIFLLLLFLGNSTIAHVLRSAHEVTVAPIRALSTEDVTDQGKKGGGEKKEEDNENNRKEKRYKWNTFVGGQIQWTHNCMPTLH